jgi:fucose 4-O-acetylase-like acetyltransferase
MVVTPPTLGETSTGDVAPSRRAWVDNLRVSIIIGVIGAHVSLIYALDVGWYYEERTASRAAKAVLAGIFSPGLVFGMGLLFFIAGLFTPGALRRKGPRRFVVDRLWRLGAPTAVYVFVINPAMNVIGDHAMGIGEGFADYFRRTYRDDVELGVAWFIFALLLFSIAYAIWRSHHGASTIDAPLRRGELAQAMAFIAVASYVVRLVWPFLSTGEMLGLNLWEYPQMITLFVLGLLAEERGWLVEGLSSRVRRACGIAAGAGLVLTVVLAVALTLSDDADPFLGGLRLEAALIPLAEAAIAVGMSLWLVDWFRRRWNRAGTVVRGMGRASFVAYLVHAPITVVLAAVLRRVDVAGEFKFVVVMVLSVIASFGLGWLLTRGRATSRIL